MFSLAACVWIVALSFIFTNGKRIPVSGWYALPVALVLAVEVVGCQAPQQRGRQTHGTRCQQLIEQQGQCAALLGSGQRHEQVTPAGRVIASGDQAAHLAQQDLAGAAQLAQAIGHGTAGQGGVVAGLR